MKIAVSIESQATLRELRDKISRLIKVPERQLVLLLLDHEKGLRELINDGQVIQELLEDLHEIYCVETPQIEEPKRPVETSQLVIVFVNRVGAGNSSRLFGPLFSCCASREASFKQIQSEMLQSLSCIVRDTIDMNIIRESSIFKLKVVGGLQDKSYLPEDVDHPLFMPTVEKAISHCDDRDYRGPVHLMLVCEWEQDMKELILIDESDIPVAAVDPNIEFVKERSQMINQVSLQDCFDLYFREERLGADNAWMCPGCKRRQQSLKKLSLWSVPDVFIIHLKRFRQISSSHRNKLSTHVVFPINNLDMNQYLDPRHSINSNRDLRRYSRNVARDSSLSRLNGHVLNGSSHTLPGILYEPWQRPSLRFSRISSPVQDCNIYDLYAVVNHKGSMQSGHYTAFCKNPVKGSWFSFDDTRVIPIPEESVISTDAYILFYQRRSLSTCSSETRSPEIHWSLRVSPSHYAVPKTSRSDDDLASHQINRSKSKLIIHFK